MRQIFSVKRWDSSEKREVMTIQTGIDGYRLIADRTGRHGPGQNPQFEYDKKGNLPFAKSYVKKKTSDGTWHEVSTIAFWDEYVQKTKQGEGTHFWKSKGHIMLSKWVEILPVRRAFPGELSGLHVQSEDIPQEIPEDKQEQQTVDIPDKLSQEQLENQLVSSG